MRTHWLTVGCALAITCAVPALADKVAGDDPAAEVPSLTSRHTSVYNKVDYLIPQGWVVIDGETDWIAPSMDRQEGHVLYDPAVDPTYSVGVILPYLSVADVQQRRRASLEALARATFDALQEVMGARPVTEPFARELGGKPSWSIQVEMPGGRVLHQVFLTLSDGQVGIAAVVGPPDKAPQAIALTDAIAATIQPEGGDAAAQEQSNRSQQEASE